MSIALTSPSALITQHPLNIARKEIYESMARLSTGKRLNGVTDNVVDINAQTTLNSEIRGLAQAVKNAGVGMAINETADSALSEVSDILQRMRELAVEAASTAISDTTRAALNDELTAQHVLITKIAADTEYNGQALIDGTFSSQSIQIGANSTNGSVSYSLSSTASASLGAYVSEGYTRVPVTAAATEPSNNTTASEDYTVGSSTIEATAAESAKDVAAKINAVSGSTGVTATAETYAHLLSTNSGSESYTIEINSTTTSSFSISSTDVSGAVTAINAISGTTGVTAVATSDYKVLLHDADGDDITIENTTSSLANLDVYAVKRDGSTTQGSSATDLAASGGNDATRVIGTLRLISDSEFTVAQAGTSTLGYLVAGTAARTAISSIDLTGTDLTGSIKATQAIESIDSAINQVAAIRGTIAANTRTFEHSINVNTAVGADKSVGLAKLEDADFAIETARLAKAMMLRKASTAMLAQANTNEEMVLSLLRQFQV